MNESENENRGILNMSRRSLFMAGVATVAVAGLVASTRQAESKIVDLGLAKRTIIGYSWPWTARPGEKVAFKVSTYAPGDYTASLVRLICADAITDNGKHYKEEPLTAAFAGTYTGRHQPIYSGSFVEITSTSALDRAGSFTLVASVQPTAVKRGTELSGEGFSPASLGQTASAAHAQHLVARWDDTTKTGWALAIDVKDFGAFVGGDGSGAIEKVALAQPLAKRRWVRVSVSYDADTGRVRLTQAPRDDGPGDRVWRTSESVEGTVKRPPQTGALRIGAATGGACHDRVRGAARG